MLQLTNIDLTDELMSHHMVDADVWTVANMDSLVEWLKTQLHEGQSWEDVEMTGVPLGAFYTLVREAVPMTALLEACRAVLEYHDNPAKHDQLAFEATAGNVTGLDALLGRVQAAVDDAGGECDETHR
jgi:erythromycin esterase-like protein